MNRAQRKAYFDKVAANMEEFGYHLTYVTAGDTPSFCYSTGIYRNFTIPEIIISSLPQGLCAALIDHYVTRFKGTQSVPRNEKLDDLSDRFPVYLIEAPKLRIQDYVLSSIRFYEDRDYHYLQLVYPDTQGFFPGEQGYHYDQEIFGTLKT